eukprot:CAMPEP_0195129848 /NCGR_PEP_ID=MMETSP0448-20130528/142058_1 /TAXON_ID=66468 /ORGANISM="Heterocapsa triquestra, Strain CCMP 448" /LENGTH=31 /DNA_ID= /DNA_START= /DNA_END= /DNA_ORIENTATION=
MPTARSALKSRKPGRRQRRPQGACRKAGRPR